MFSTLASAVHCPFRRRTPRPGPHGHEKKAKSKRSKSKKEKEKRNSLRICALSNHQSSMIPPSHHPYPRPSLSTLHPSFSQTIPPGHRPPRTPSSRARLLALACMFAYIDTAGTAISFSKRDHRQLPTTATRTPLLAPRARVSAVACVFLTAAASKQAGRQASKQASKQASLPTSLPTCQPASLPTTHPSTTCSWGHGGVPASLAARTRTHARFRFCCPMGIEGEGCCLR
ncbi:uncharacterized protein K452DRAFT_139287 [Aplosporella prunicola CBS 121167]|uniref:Uncharacterized protein n=1 Tax=Aplosporella prunicola CBS 121167 TaxID=1176127 RepID=A0A6A6AYG0_9PEZI|nr:uncharacterized protein K452DRAFT_139287 [Aplosporella prunicola CBS 121167]KAF2136223.1 hypothetical protein K452DRAFT_139287 [Aplosporella prunicola CBS 121167]